MKRNSGFTLVELSIVLVIISLITGAIVSGREMIHTARLNSVMVDFNKYQTAYNTFSAKYDALPGDFDEASDYWPGESYDGDGNGYICTFAGDVSTWNEAVNFFNHLYQAGMIEGYYKRWTGAFLPADKDNLIPSKQIGRSAFYPWCAGLKVLFFTGASHGLYTAADGNYMVFGYDWVNGANFVDNPLAPSEAKMIDKKMDDGKPGTGKMVVSGSPIPASASGNCASSHLIGDIDTATYNVDDSLEDLIGNPIKCRLGMALD